MLLTGDTGPMHVAAAVGTPVARGVRALDAVALRPARRARTGSSASTCRAARATGSVCPRRCQGHTPDCLTGVARRRRRRPRDGRCCGLSRRRTRGCAVSVLDVETAGRPSAGRPRPVARRASCEAGRGRGQPLDQAAAARAVDGVTLARSVHTSRGFAVVVRRALSPPDACRHPCAPRPSPRSSAGSARFRGAAGSSTEPTRWSGTSRTWSRRATDRVRGPGRPRPVPRGSGRAPRLCFTRPGDGDRVRPAPGPARRGLAHGGVRPLGVCGRQVDDEAYVGPIVPALGPRLPDASRWWGSDHGRTSACAAGAIALQEFVTPQPRDIAATPVRRLRGWRTLAPSRARVGGARRRPSPR